MASPEPTPQQQIEAALTFLAGRCDRAHDRDGQGFSAAHATRGRTWAALLKRRGALPPAILGEVWEVLRTYEHTQLRAAGLLLPQERPARPPVLSADLLAEVLLVVYRGEQQCLVACRTHDETPPGVGPRFKAWLPLAQLAEDPTGRVLRLLGVWEDDPRRSGTQPPMLLRVEGLAAPLSVLERLRRSMEESRSPAALRAAGNEVHCTPGLTEAQLQDLRTVYVRVLRRLRDSAARPQRTNPVPVGKVGVGNYDY